MGFVASTIELLIGSLAERDLTGAPLNLSPKEVLRMSQRDVRGLWLQKDDTGRQNPLHSQQHNGGW